MPEPMSHHSAFIHDDKLFCYGGLIGSQGSKSNGDFWILDLKTNMWKNQVITTKAKKGDVTQNPSCEARDDHASHFDPTSKILYVFGGYVNGDKSNDMWSFNLTTEVWKCLHSGDYKKVTNNNKIPCPRVGARMVQIDETTIYIHNGHDDDNEKISDMWKFDLETN
jgi:hypothetical protein